MSANKYKLTYFATRERGEFIRYLFAYANVPYEEVDIKLEDWAKEKPKFPFGSVPYLEVNGQVGINQSLAIGRYLAREFGLAGKDNLQMAQIEQLVDGCLDLFSTYDLFIHDCLYTQDKKKQESSYEVFRTKSWIPWMDRYSGFLKKSGTGWFVGDKATFADLYIAEWTDRIVTLWDPTALDKHPELKAHRDRVNKLPAIAKRIASRPKYEI